MKKRPLFTSTFACCWFAMSLGVKAASSYEPYYFSNVAGLAGNAGGADGTGSAARFNNPEGAAIDKAQNVYVADFSGHTIRKVTPAGVVTTLAGAAGSAGSIDATGSAARFNNPARLAVDGTGNVYVGDFSNHTIRKVTPAGVVSTFAGSPGQGGSVDGTGSAARFRNPAGVALDGAGNLYVADVSNHTIRKITPVGVVTTLAGSPGVIGSIDGSGSAARFNNPVGVGVDSANNIYVADYGNHTIRKITLAGVVTTLAGSAGNSGSADGTGSAARFFNPQAVALDSARNAYVADFGNHTIRKITPSGIVTTLAGFPGIVGSANGTGNVARFNGPAGVAVDNSGRVYVADTFNQTVRAGRAAPPVTRPSTDTPQSIPDHDFSAVFSSVFSVPASGDTSSGALMSVAVNITHPAPSDLKIVLAGPFNSQTNTQPTVVLWDHETILDANQQPMANIHSLDTIPFLGPGEYDLSVLDNISTHAGTLDSWSVTVDPSYPDHLGPPSVNQFADAANAPLPAQITFGDTFTVVAKAIGNPSSIKIAKLGLTISGQRSYILPEASEPPSSTTGAMLSFTEPFLPPGLYQIASTAKDTAGFSTTTSASLTVQRLFGLFSVSNLVTTLNPDKTTSFTGLLRLENHTATASTNLRVRLITKAGSAYTDNAGPPTLPAPQELSQFAVDPLAPGATFQAPISGTAPAPIQLNGNQGIGFQVFALLEELNGGNWIAVDALKVMEGLWPTVNGFNGPGGGVNGPRPDFGGTPLDPFILNSIAINGPTSVNDSAQATYTATATARNSTSSASATVVPQWSASKFTINANGVFQAGHVSTDTIVDITATYTLGGVTKTQTRSVNVLAGPSQPLNISTRLRVLSGDNALIGGFIITPTDSKKVIIRGRGPSLSAVQGVLADPTLELHQGSTTLVTNDNWKDDQQAEIEATTIPPTNGLEAAIVRTLNPGAYTAILRGKDDAIGIGLVEVYDLTQAANSKLANISTRGFVDSGDNVMIGGFILGGSTVPTKVLVRAIGPSLQGSGINNSLADPTLELHDVNGALLSSNDNWKNTDQAAIEATTIPPSNDLESAILAILPAGNYTAIVAGKGGGAGVGLVEVYNLP